MLLSIFAEIHQEITNRVNIYYTEQRKMGCKTQEEINLKNNNLKLNILSTASK